MKLLPIIAAASFISCSAADAGTTIGGTVTVNMAGNFKNPVTAHFTFMSCTLTVSLVPNNANAISTLTLGTVLSSLGGLESASAQGIISPDGTTFTCSPTVQYRWENIDPTLQMAIAYKIGATDITGATHPGTKKQLIEVIPIPPTLGTVTTLNVNPKL
jgi:hypothetical protein